MKNLFKCGILGLLLLLCLALAGCTDKDKAQVLTLIHEVEKSDGQKLFKLCTTKSKEAYGEAGIIERTDNIRSLATLKAIAYRSIVKDKKESTGDCLVYKGKAKVKTEFGEYEKEVALSFEKKEDQLLLVFKPSVILPGLNDDAEVDVTYTAPRRGTIYDRNGKVLATDKNDARTYPYAAIASPIVGYVRDVTEQDLLAGRAENAYLGMPLGRAGLESIYQDKLAGKIGFQLSFSDAPNEVLVKSEPKDGEDIYTTLDMNLQQAAFDVVAGNMSAVVGMNPQNGQVLSLVSTPAYDSNKWIDENLSEEDYNQVLADGYAPSLGHFANIYTPGSTQKLFTTLIGLKEGTLTPETYYNIYGSDWQPDRSWGGYKVHRVTPINGAIGLEQALVSSDNIFFAQVGLALGSEKLVAGLSRLGYGQKMPGDLPVQQSQITNTGQIDVYHQTGIADTSFGQYQIQISPYQLCATYGLLVNGGKIMKPSLLLNDEPKVWVDQVASQAHLDFINQSLLKATNITHPNASRSFAQVSGKTGTAEVGPKGTINLGWYAANDLSNPTCTMVVMVNHVENRGGSDYNTGLYGQILDKAYAAGPYNPGKGILAERAEKAEQDKKKQ